MKPIEPTPRERAASGNGDLQEWIEYEADVNRDPDWMGIGDPDPKYDLANNYATLEDIFCNQLERAFYDIKKDQRTDDTADSEDGTGSTS